MVLLCKSKAITRRQCIKSIGKDEEGNREKASRGKQRKNIDAKKSESRRVKAPLAEVNPLTGLGGELRMIHNQYSCLFPRGSGKSERSKIFILEKTDKKNIHRLLEGKKPGKKPSD